MYFKWGLIICAAILVFIGLRMHYDPELFTTREFPLALGSAFEVAVTMRHLLASFIIALASIAFFSSNITDPVSQRSILSGCILAFGIMCITLGTLAFMQMAELRGGSILFGVLSIICLFHRLTIKKSD